MSVDAVTSRMAQIQALMAGALGTGGTLAPAASSPAQAASTDFSSQLNTAKAASVAPATSPSGEGSQYDSLIRESATRNGISPALLKGLIRQESNFDPSAGSGAGAGAQGLTQLMPGTAAAVGVTDPTDPAQAIEGGAKYLAQQLKAFDGDVSKALAAYNAGPGAVSRYGGVPPFAETQAYVQQVQAYAGTYAADFPSGAGATAASATAGTDASSAALAALQATLGTAGSNPASAPSTLTQSLTAASSDTSGATSNLGYSTV